MLAETLLTACSIVALVTVLFAGYNLVTDRATDQRIQHIYNVALSATLILFAAGLVAIAVG